MHKIYVFILPFCIELLLKKTCDCWQCSRHCDMICILVQFITDISRSLKQLILFLCSLLLFNNIMSHAMQRDAKSNKQSYEKCSHLAMNKKWYIILLHPRVHLSVIYGAIALLYVRNILWRNRRVPHMSDIKYINRC